MTTAHCDKYGFKTLEVGASKYVTGVSTTYASTLYHKYCQRMPGMNLRRFLWHYEEGHDGIKVTRLPDADRPIQPWERHGGQPPLCECGAVQARNDITGHYCGCCSNCFPF